MDHIKQLIRKILLGWSPSYGMRFCIVVGILLLYVAAIVMATSKTFFVDRPHYAALVKRIKRESLDVQQLRGTIYSETGDMIAASLPKYDIYFNFKDADDIYYKTVVDTLPDGSTKRHRIAVKLLSQDTIDYYFSPNGPAAQYMHKLAPHKSAAEHAAGMRNAFRRRDRYYLAIRAVSYLNCKKMQQEAPFFSKDRNHIGLIFEERPFRNRPYGDSRMASSTIGGVFSADTIRIIDDKEVNLKGHGRNGLERTFDSLLAGKPGVGYVDKVKSTRALVVQQEPEDGADVYTTLDMEMQQLLDYELNKRILELGASGGWAAVMETATGKIKAISNLKRTGDVCREDYNHFVQDLYDPGSTFKTVSYMILLDDDKISPETIVDTGNYPGHYSTWNYHGKQISDDHPVGTVTADEAMVQSSNISLAKLTTGAYEKDPQRYLDLIDKTRIFEDMHLEQEFDLANRPRNRKYKDANWSKMSLAQISYGYETRIPGMYILNFYNAIANDGKLMRPYIVDRVVKDGKVLYRREPEVVNSRICKPETLKKVRHALEGVVEHGTARTEWNSQGTIIKEGAQSRKLKIAGKTGTAQRYANGGYSSQNGHYVSFAGYFPADDPQYTCVVVMDVRPGGNFGRPGGGYMAGPVFRNFAEQVYARSCRRSLKDIKPDSANIAMQGHYPKAKRGPERLTSDVAGGLGLSRHYDKIDPRNVNLNAVTQGVVPSVMDMGAVDALYMLESVGLRVTISGKGKVYSQSIPAGSQCKKGQAITISLR